MYAFKDFQMLHRFTALSDCHQQAHKMAAGNMAMAAFVCAVLAIKIHRLLLIHSPDDLQTAQERLAKDVDREKVQQHHREGPHFGPRPVARIVRCSWQ